MAVGDDGVGVTGAVGVDVRDCLVQCRDDFDADNRGEIFARPVVAVGVDHVGAADEEFFALGANAHFNLLAREAGGDLRQKLGGDGAVNEQTFGGVAHAIAAVFGVVGDGDGHVDLRAGVNINVAVAVQVFDDRDGAGGDDSFNQPASAARNHHINVVAFAQ